MKVIRQHYWAANPKAPARLIVNALIVANPLERLFLRRQMTARRHNLRPSRNWPGLRQHGASYVLAAKGAPNQDRGRRPVYPKLVERALLNRHSAVELWCVGLGAALMQHTWLAGCGVVLMGCVVPRMFERLRHGKRT